MPWIHEAATALRVIGLRDRLRCPECHGVGTWKPYGGRDGTPRRWLCQWCGYYLTRVTEETQCYFDKNVHEWLEASATPGSTTPQLVLDCRRSLPDDVYPWPWRG